MICWQLFLPPVIVKCKLRAPYKCLRGHWPRVDIDDGSPQTQWSFFSPQNSNSTERCVWEDCEVVWQHNKPCLASEISSQYRIWWSYAVAVWRKKVGASARQTSVTESFATSRHYSGTEKQSVAIGHVYHCHWLWESDSCLSRLQFLCWCSNNRSSPHSSNYFLWSFLVQNPYHIGICSASLGFTCWWIC